MTTIISEFIQGFLIGIIIESCIIIGIITYAKHTTTNKDKGDVNDD